MVTDIRNYSHMRRLVSPRGPGDVLNFRTHRHVHETAALAGISYCDGPCYGRESASMTRR